MADSYDVVVVGGGTGGYSCALRSAQLGKRVALVERDERLGGTCLLRGCIPTKALLQSAAVMDAVTRADEFGISAKGEPDWPAVRAFEDRIVDKLVSGVTGLLKARKVDVIRGTAAIGPGPSVVVDGRTIAATDVVIATGSRPKLLPGVEVSEHVITSDQALWYPNIPTSAIVIGAGAVGLEFASFYRSMGAEVTIVEALPRIAPLEDEALSKELARAYRRRGIAMHAGARVQSIGEAGGRATVTIDVNGQATTLTADICLVATGRAPVTDGLGLEAAGVATDRGFVKVDGQFRTTVPHVWAVGDVASTPLQLAHVAYTEGIAAAERIAGIAVADIDYLGIPRVTYCTPEVASVGRTEEQARAEGRDVEVEVFNFQGVGKANIVGEGGIVKVVAEKGGAVLGVHMVGPWVTEQLSGGYLAVNWEATVAEIAEFIQPHPSLTELFGETVLSLTGRSLNA